MLQLSIIMCCKMWKHYFRPAMYYLKKILVRLLNRILHITQCQILCSILTLVLLIFLWTRSYEENQTLKESKNPVILWWTQSFPGTSDTIKCPDGYNCNVYSLRNITKLYKVHAYLFYGSSIRFSDMPLPRNPEDVIWGLFHEESPRNIEELMFEPVLKLFNFSSTYSRFSDISFPLQHLENFLDITSTKYYVNTSMKNIHLKEIAPILYLQTDCDTSSERDAYVKELMKLVQIDSYGTCLNNKALPDIYKFEYLNKLNDDGFLNIVSKYKFVIAIENGVCKDYITEKFWRAIKVGTVPIYFGSPTIRDWLPNNKSAILLEDYPTPELLINHINKLLNNDTLYETYLEHKTKKIITNKRLRDVYENFPYQLDPFESASLLECLVCRHIHDRLNGATHAFVIDKSHYDCPKPISALSLQVNPKNSWVHSYEFTEKRAEEIYKRIMNQH